MFLSSQQPYKQLSLNIAVFEIFDCSINVNLISVATRNFLTQFSYFALLFHTILSFIFDFNFSLSFVVQFLRMQS